MNGTILLLHAGKNCFFGQVHCCTQMTSTKTKDFGYRAKSYGNQCQYLVVKHREMPEDEPNKEDRARLAHTVAIFARDTE